MKTATLVTVVKRALGFAGAAWLVLSVMSLGDLFSEYPGIVDVVGQALSVGIVVFAVALAMLVLRLHRELEELRRQVSDVESEAAS